MKESPLSPTDSQERVDAAARCAATLSQLTTSIAASRSVARVFAAAVDAPLHDLQVVAELLEQHATRELHGRLTAERYGEVTRRG